MDVTHYTAAELTVLLAIDQNALLDLAADGLLVLEPDGFTRESVEQFIAKFMAGGRG